MPSIDPAAPEHVGVMIAVPSRGQVRIEWAASLSCLAMPINFTRVLKIIVGRDIVEARNVAVKAAQEANAAYLFFLDDDVLVPNQTLHRMVTVMENETDIDLLTGIVPIKSQEPAPCIFKDERPGPYWGWTFNKRCEIDSCGMAACLIRVSAFDKVEEPWFDWQSSADGANSAEVGEDIYFCRKLKAAGGRLVADGGVCCGHMDEDGKVFSIGIDSAPMKRGAEALKDFIALEAGVA